MPLSPPPPDAGPCRICSGSLQPFHSRRQLRLMRCRSCHVVCQEPEPSPAALAAGFDAAYFTAGEGDGYSDYLAMERSHRHQARRRLRALPPLSPGRHPRLLDVGCAAGFLLDEARKQGWHVTGVELNEAMATVGRERLDLDIVTGSLDDVPVTEPFDAVFMMNVLEHLASPRHVEGQLARLVRPGGILMIETWDEASLVARLQGAHWHQWSPLVPYYHVRRSLDALFAAERWEHGRWRRAVKWIPVWRGLEILGVQRGAQRRHRAPWCWEIPYAAGDLVLASYRRR